VPDRNGRSHTPSRKVGAALGVPILALAEVALKRITELSRRSCRSPKSAATGLMRCGKCHGDAAAAAGCRR
jgi:hypothetical protein